MVSKQEFSSIDFAINEQSFIRALYDIEREGASHAVFESVFGEETMIYLTITEQELRNALRDIERAKERGFTHTEALFNLSQVGETIGDDLATYSGRVILKAGTERNQDYGNMDADHINWYRYENGQVIDTDE